MKITVKYEDGQELVLPDVTDFALVARFIEVIGGPDTLARERVTKMFSHHADGEGLRELIKELAESALTLRSYLSYPPLQVRQETPHGDPSSVS